MVKQAVSHYVMEKELLPEKDDDYVYAESDASS